MGTVSAVTEKTCATCRATLPLTGFHPDRTRADGRRATCKDCRRAESRAYGERWRATNQQMANAYSRNWRVSHREARGRYRRAWRTANPAKVRDQLQRQKARRQSQVCAHEGCLAIGPVQLAWQLNPHRCWMCGTGLDIRARRGEPAHVHFDHVMPLARGGPHCAENLRPSCAPCNAKKGAQIPAEVGGLMSVLGAVCAAAPPRGCES